MMYHSVSIFVHSSKPLGYRTHLEVTLTLSADHARLGAKNGPVHGELATLTNKFQITEFAGSEERSEIDPTAVS